MARAGARHSRGRIAQVAEELYLLAIGVALLGATRSAGFDLSSKFVLISSILTYAFGLRARNQSNGRVLDVAIWPGTLFLLAGLFALLPVQTVSPAWALVALAFAEFDRRSAHALSIVVSAVVLVRCLGIDLSPRPAHRGHCAGHCDLLGRDAAPAGRHSAAPLLFAARHGVVGRTHLPRGQRLDSHDGMGCGGDRTAGRGLRITRPSAAPFGPRALSRVHAQALLLGSAQFGNAAAHYELHRARIPAGRRQLGLHSLPRPGAEVFVDRRPTAPRRESRSGARRGWRRTPPWCP